MPRPANFLEWWQKQSSSLHRNSDQLFYETKSLEHINVINTLPQRPSAIADLGSGFGELLSCYIKHGLPVHIVQDFNPKALDKAKELCLGLSDRPIHYTNVPVEILVRDTPCDLLIATGSINQYLEYGLLDKLLVAISSNKSINSVIFFDCVDPIQYIVSMPYSSFRASKQKRTLLGTLLAIKNLIKKASAFAYIVFISHIRLQPTSFYLGKPGMGYGYLPSAMRALASKNKFLIKLIRSSQYEYRYHAILLRNEQHD